MTLMPLDLWVFLRWWRCQGSPTASADADVGFGDQLHSDPMAIHRAKWHAMMVYFWLCAPETFHILHETTRLPYCMLRSRWLSKVHNASASEDSRGAQFIHQSSRNRGIVAG